MHTKPLSLTEGPIGRSILLFALPLLMGNVFQQFYNAFDSWVVGQFIGSAALAAVGSSGNLIFMMTGFFNGVAMGAGVIIGRYYGARDYTAMRRAIHTDIAFGLIAGLALTVAGIAFTPTILRWMGTPEEVLPQSIEYFRWYSSGVLFTVMYNIFVGILHAVGDSRHPLYYLMFSTCVNIVLDLLFVAVFHWGVGSAAIATTISQGVSAVLCCIHLLRAKDTPYQMNWREIRIHSQTLKSILHHGIPSGVQNSVIGLANLVVQSNINAFGTAAMAGCGAFSKVEGFVFMPVMCFCQALTTFVSQNLGARQHSRTKKSIAFGLTCAVFMAETIGIACYFFAPSLIGLFNDSPEVVFFGVRHMRTISLFYFLMAMSHGIAAVLRGAGKASVPMATMLVCWCLIRVTYITIAVQFRPELTTVSWAYPITWTLSTIVFVIYFFKADWIHTFDKTKNA